MNFKLNFPISKSDFDLKHGDGIVLLGSCFSDSMSYYFRNAGFDVLSNPFGTLFHPLAISKVINCSESDFDQFILQRDDLFFSWIASGNVYSTSKEELIELLKDARRNLMDSLKSAKILVVTFGTSWGYSYSEYGLVANCHKQPQKEFNKTLYTVGDMFTEWTSVIQNLKSKNPGLNIVFTVSPVRHIKDGLIENNRSKSRLIELSHQLSEMENFYFPAYEIVMDELRDYRFFKNDLVHPSSDTTKYVWKRFQDFVFSEGTKKLCNQIEQINATLDHKSLYPESNADIKRIEQGNVKKQDLSRKHPNIYWK